MKARDRSRWLEPSPPLPVDDDEPPPAPPERPAPPPAPDAAARSEPDRET